MAVQTNATNRARLGAQLLDRVDPHWASSIDREKFDMRFQGGSFEKTCALTQWKGSYQVGIVALGIASDMDAIRHGFHVGMYSGLQGDAYIKAYEILTAAWLVEIDARL